MKNYDYPKNMVDAAIKCRLAILTLSDTRYVCMIIGLKNVEMHNYDAGTSVTIEMYEYIRFTGHSMIRNVAIPFNFTMAKTKGSWNGDFRTLKLEDVEEDDEKD